MINLNQPLRILITGGTIDSFYDGVKDTVTPSERSALPKYFKNLKLDWVIEIVEICMKDSREINDEDRIKILSEIESSKEENILITHGTYTMPDTARYIEANSKANTKKIILTGSMIPLDGFNLSDAGFNLGFAIGSFNSITPGVYVCMNGYLFSANEVIKKLNEGRFASIFNK